MCILCKSTCYSCSRRSTPGAWCALFRPFFWIWSILDLVGHSTSQLLILIWLWEEVVGSGRRVWLCGGCVASAPNSAELWLPARNFSRFYPWSDVTHVIWRTRLPLFSRVIVKRSGSLGTRLAMESVPRM